MHFFRSASLLFVLSLSLVACNSDDDMQISTSTEAPEWPEYEYTLSTGTPQEQIDRFVALNNLDTTVSASGLVYTILDPGDQSSTAGGSTAIEVYYRGTVIDGRVFDRSGDTPSRLPLNNLILAWKEAIPLLGRGGRQLLIVRPALGYGPGGNSGAQIRGSDVLLFDIQLEDFE